jgi:predicted nuclease of predicted toxin-antitoxin system
MHLLIDMNLSPKWADFLELSGLAATHWSALGAANASDSAIMDYARMSGMVILTHDLDFGAILAATGGNAPSVVQIRSDDLQIAAIGDLLVGALQQVREFLGEGALVTIETARTRISVLPIGERR